MRSKIHTYTDDGKRIIVSLVNKQAIIQIDDKRYKINPKYRLSDFFNALGTKREARGLANILILISDEGDN
jgi:hypothetical protein